ncbi:MAG: hypothetical protein ROY99_03090 [Ignavibacterium sp.]|nr:hypothetical protein [Ignavibacterium sp.]
MKKQIVTLLSVIVISVISLTGCEPFLVNKIIARNLAAAEVKLNIRGQIYSVPSGETLILNDFKKGSFEYETIYSVPAGATEFAAEGEVAGEIVLNAGTEVLIVYTSTLVEEKYTLYGSMTSSDDVNRTDPFATGNP